MPLYQESGFPEHRRLLSQISPVFCLFSLRPLLLVRISNRVWKFGKSESFSLFQTRQSIHLEAFFFQDLMFLKIERKLIFYISFLLFSSCCIGSVAKFKKVKILNSWLLSEGLGNDRPAGHTPPAKHINIARKHCKALWKCSFKENLLLICSRMYCLFV